MKRQDIIDVYKARFKKISGYFQKVPEDLSVNDIHHFRTEMKRLRAFIRLINLSSPNHQQKLPKELKKFYNAVGDIRNLQLQRERISKLANAPGIGIPQLYLHCLETAEKIIHKKARQIATTISLKDFEKKLIDSVQDNVDEEIKLEFVEKNRNKIRLLLTLPSYYDEALHELRKVFKDLMYDFKYVKSAINIELPSSLSSLKAMETMTDTLGDFHDLCVALFLMSPVYIKQFPDLGPIDDLNKIQSHFVQKKEMLKNEIIQSLVPVKEHLEGKILIQP